MEHLSKVVFALAAAVLCYGTYISITLSDNVQNNAEHLFIPAIALFSAAAAAELIWGERRSS